MTDLKDIIADIVKHTATNFIENVKIIDIEDETLIETIDLDKSVILMGKLHNPISKINDEIGLGNLGFLKGVLNLSNYKTTGATVEVEHRERNGETIPDGLLFKDQEGNTDYYRFMSKEIINQKLKTVKFKGAKWNVEIEPTKQKVAELKSAASIYGENETNFKLKTEKGNLIITLGSVKSSYAGKRVFATGVTGTYKEDSAWPLSKVLTILNLGMSGKCKMSVSEQGVLKITIDSGIGTYDYILPSINI
jgi:hypothetical protein